MAKLQMKLSLKKCVAMKNWTRRVRCRRSKPDMINSPPVKRFFLAKEEEVGESEDDHVDDYCRNWGPSIALHREYEDKIAALEEEIKQAKADTEYWYWKSEELESHLQNQRLQFEMAENAREVSCQSDDAVTAPAPANQTSTRQNAPLTANQELTSGGAEFVKKMRRELLCCHAAIFASV